VLRERAAAAEEEAGGRAAQLKKKVDGLALDIPAKVSHDDHLFGSVGTRDIVNALAEKGFELDPRQVHLHENFKRLGRYEVVLGLHRDVHAQIAVNVVDVDPQGRDLDEVIAEATGETETPAPAEGE